MKSFNPKTMVISRFIPLAILFTHGLLTACNNGGTYHAREKQMLTTAMPSTLRSGAKDQDYILLGIYHKILNNVNNSVAVDEALQELYNSVTGESKIEKKLNFQKALIWCKECTGKKLNVYHLQHSMYVKHYYLVLGAIAAGIADGEPTQPCYIAPDKKENLLDCAKRYNKERLNPELQKIINALLCIDEIKQLTDESLDAFHNEDLWKRYRNYSSLREDMSPVSPLYEDINKIIGDILRKIMQCTDTVQGIEKLVSRIHPEDVALHRLIFEIIDETHPNPKGTNVLHPAAYKILSKKGYPIALSKENLDRIITYLKENHVHLFYRYQPDIALFHDEASKDDIQFNAAYMNIYYASTSEGAHEALKALHTLVRDKNLNFQKVLTRCKKYTGLELNVRHLSHSMYVKHYYLVLDVIAAGVADAEPRQFCCVAPDNKENLRACAERYKKDRPYDRELQRIIEQLGSL